jgi:hypothetical protein
VDARVLEPPHQKPLQHVKFRFVESDLGAIDDGAADAQSDSIIDSFGRRVIDHRALALMSGVTLRSSGGAMFADLIPCANGPSENARQASALGQKSVIPTWFPTSRLE